MQLFDETALAQPSRLTGNTSAMLAALADLGCSKHVLAALLDIDNLHKDHIRFLTGPVIQHRSPWAETTPQWLYQAAIADRLRIILDEHARGKTGWQVGPAELTAVMYPATMDAPLPLEYTDIYLWAAAKANARHYCKTEADIWSQTGGDPVQDCQITGPSGRYHHAYRQLCSDIRARIINAATGRARTAKSAGAPEVTTQQLSLFEG